MSDNSKKKKSHGFFIFLLISIVFVTGFVMFKFIECKMSESYVDGNGTIQGNTDGNLHLFRRSANINDIVVSSDLDLSNFGAKYTITPQTDIDGLELTVNFLDKNKNILTSKGKTLGNVKKGVQVSFSISFIDLGLSVALSVQYETLAVTGGTISYFSYFS